MSMNYYSTYVINERNDKSFLFSKNNIVTKWNKYKRGTNLTRFIPQNLCVSVYACARVRRVSRAGVRAGRGHALASQTGYFRTTVETLQKSHIHMNPRLVDEVKGVKCLTLFVIRNAETKLLVCQVLYSINFILVEYL